jgi:hypothetical protein
MSVRALMMLILILGGGLAWVVRQSELQRRAVTGIEKAGGMVVYDYEVSSVLSREGARKTWCPRWLSRVTEVL